MTKEQYWDDKEAKKKAKAEQSALKKGLNHVLLYRKAVLDAQAQQRRAKSRLRQRAPLKALGLRYLGPVKP